MSIVSNLLDTLDLNKKEDVSADLYNHKIKKNSKILNNVLEEVEQVINSFSSEIDKEHYIIMLEPEELQAGKHRNFYSNSNDIGNGAREKFISVVNENPSKFTRLKSLLHDKYLYIWLKAGKNKNIHTLLEIQKYM